MDKKPDPKAISRDTEALAKAAHETGIKPTKILTAMEAAEAATKPATVKKKAVAGAKLFGIISPMTNYGMGVMMVPAGTGFAVDEDEAIRLLKTGDFEIHNEGEIPPELAPYVKPKRRRLYRQPSDVPGPRAGTPREGAEQPVDPKVLKMAKEARENVR
jgi:hypothetical protein